MRRKAVDVTELVETSLFNDNPLPLVVQPAMEGVDLAEWAASHRDEIDAWFDKHGAILFRGFGLDGAAGLRERRRARSPASSSPSTATCRRRRRARRSTARRRTRPTR